MQSGTTRFIGRYRVLDELGGGGMGDVYRIWDDKTDRELALKQLKFSYPRALHYFKREFRAVASLSHHRGLSIIRTLARIHPEEWCLYAPIATVVAIASGMLDRSSRRGP